jgi:hypothetical protein
LVSDRGTEFAESLADVLGELERRFTNWNPMKSNPSVNFVIRVFSRLIVSPMRDANSPKYRLCD